MNTETLAEPTVVEVVTDVAVEPITLADAKAHLRVSHTNDDAKITALLGRAREQAEHLTGRSFAPKTLRVVVSTWGDAIELPRGPVNAVSHVRYLDQDGVEQTLSASNYYLDTKAAIAVVRRAPDVRYPLLSARLDAVRVQYTAGTWVASPRSAFEWMLIKVAQMYENREADVPVQAYSLLDPYRVHGVG
jgi:uncharacterized phiE125 gp8 family phage protein